MKRKPREEKVTHSCGECRHAKPVYRFHTLSIGGMPTLADCEYVRERCVLLSEKACDGHFKPC